MGLGNRTLRLAQELLASGGPEPNRYITLAWRGSLDSGRYAQAAAYARTLPTTTLSERLERSRFLGDAYWQAGYNARASICFHSAIQEYRTARVAQSDGLPTDSYRELLITYLHWCRDAARHPWARWLISERMMSGCWQELLLLQKQGVLGLHDAPKLTLLFDELTRLRRYGAPISVALAPPFSETDSVLGQINMDRRELRKRMVAGPRPEVDEIEQLQLHSRLIGDAAGELKAALLVRALGANPDWPSSALAQIQWSRSTLLWWLWCWLRRRGAF
jgi:hypothetical protein